MEIGSPIRASIIEFGIHAVSDALPQFGHTFLRYARNSLHNC